MDILEQGNFLEAAPRRTSHTVEDHSARKASRSDRRSDNYGAPAESFANILVERQERPEKVRAPENLGIDKSAVTDGERAAGAKVTAEAATAETANSSLAKVAQLAATVSAETTEPVVATATSTSASTEATGVQMPTGSDLAPVVLQTKTLPESEIIDSSGQTKQLSGSLKNPAAMTVTGKETSLPSPKVTELSATPKQDSTSVSTTASEMDTAVKGKATYTQAPIVNESQIVADSLKTQPKNQAVNAAASADVDTAEAGIKVAPAVDVDLGDAGESAVPDKPIAEATAPADIAVADIAVADEVEVKTEIEPEEDLPVPASEKPAAQPATDARTASVMTETDPTIPETTVTAAPDLTVVNRNPDSSLHATQTQTANDPALARNVRRQVVRQFTSQLANVTGTDQMTIKLNPENLGQVDLSFEAQDDRLSVVISASTREAEGALRDNLKDLADRIVERSARFSHVDVRVDVRDGDSRQDAKQDQKQDSRQENQRREQEKQGNGQHEQGQGQQGRQAQKAWESAMSWELADQAANEEG